MKAIGIAAIAIAILMGGALAVWAHGPVYGWGDGWGGHMMAPGYHMAGWHHGADYGYEGCPGWYGDHYPGQHMGYGWGFWGAPGERTNPNTEEGSPTTER